MTVMTKKRFAVALAAVAAMASSPAQANAGEVSGPGVLADPIAHRTCTAGGFQGDLRFPYRMSSGKVHYVGKIEYRIYKGSNKGGNSANVSWYDEATGGEFSTGSGIQDGQWHTLGGNYYRTHKDGVSFVFVFDKSLADDPQCNGWFTM